MGTNTEKKFEHAYYVETYEKRAKDVLTGKYSSAGFKLKRNISKRFIRWFIIILRSNPCERYVSHDSQQSFIIHLL